MQYDSDRTPIRIPLEDRRRLAEAFSRPPAVKPRLGWKARMIGLMTACACTLWKPDEAITDDDARFPEPEPRIEGQPHVTVGRIDLDPDTREEDQFIKYYH